MSIPESPNPAFGPTNGVDRVAFVRAVLALPPDGTIVDAIGASVGPQAADAYYTGVVAESARVSAEKAARGYVANLAASHLLGIH